MAVQGSRVLTGAPGAEKQTTQQKYLNEVLGYTDADLNGYLAQQGVDPNAAYLRGASQITDAKGNTKFVNAMGQQISGNIVSDIQAFMKNQKKSYQDYLDAKKANPGRDATILVPRETSTGSTLLGERRQASTMLGG